MAYGLRKGFKFDLVGYCGADVASDKVERKSTSSAFQFFASDKKQSIIALWTLEAKYVSVVACCS